MQSYSPLTQPHLDLKKCYGSVGDVTALFSSILLRLYQSLILPGKILGEPSKLYSIHIVYFLLRETNGSKFNDLYISLRHLNQ